MWKKCCAHNNNVKIGSYTSSSCSNRALSRLHVSRLAIYSLLQRTRAGLVLHFHSERRFLAILVPYEGENILVARNSETGVEIEVL